MSVEKAVFPVAGFGTRMLPATKTIPKEMLPLIDRPIIDYSVREVVDSGINNLIFVTSSNKKALEDYFDRNMELERSLEAGKKYDLLKEIRSFSELANITYVRQPIQKGLGHAISMPKHLIGNDPFAVILPDDVIISDKPVIKQMIECYKEIKAPVIGLMEVDKKDASKYGIVSIEKKINNRLFKLSDMVEKPETDPPSNYAIIGRYILTSNILHNIEEIEEGALGEVQLTDALKKEAEKGEIYGYVFEGNRYDCGNKIDYLRAIIELAYNKHELKEELYNIINMLGFKNGK
ncbi:MAG: UTP--glucose-1-phosphate uridylyltransferase GalU [Deferribacterota bacterium]|nr:UTP--glucose-1-phosphate uridylyltransferase GalU [Deferribacterota bacterium]